MKNIEDGWAADDALWHLIPFCQEVVEMALQITMARIHHLSFWALTYMEATRGRGADNANVEAHAALMYARLGEIERALDSVTSRLLP